MSDDEETIELPRPINLGDTLTIKRLLDEAKRVLQYLHSTKDLGIRYMRNVPIRVCIALPAEKRVLA